MDNEEAWPSVMDQLSVAASIRPESPVAVSSAGLVALNELLAYVAPPWHRRTRIYKAY